MTDETPSVSRRTVLKGLGSGAATTALASLAGCTSFRSDSSQGASIRYAQVLPPLGLDPITIDDVWSAQVANRVFDGLYTFGSGTDVVPELAAGMPERHESDSGTPVYRVEIRDDARFQNGDPVTAEDVRYSLTAPVEEDQPPKWALEPIEAIRVQGKHTLEFELDHPYPAFTYALTQPIVPKAVREANPEGFATAPVGSGPFRATTVEEGKYCTLNAWDGYWRPSKPAISQLRFVGTHSGLARSMSLRTGQNEIVERVQPKLWSVTDEMPQTNVVGSQSLHYYYVGFNCNAGPTTNSTVRKAIDHLVDIDTLVEHFVVPDETGREGESASWRQYGPVPESIASEWEFPTEQWRAYPREKDPERAKQLLNDADSTDWQPTIVVPKDPMREKFADAIVHELSNIGFKKARTEKLAWPDFRDTLKTGSPSSFNMFVGSWSGWPDPDSFLYPLFHENAEGLTNFTFYQNEPVMNDILQARETTDQAERKRRYESAIDTILADRVHLPAFTLHNTFGVADSVSGFSAHPVASVNPRFVGPEESVSLST